MARVVDKAGGYPTYGAIDRSFPNLPNRPGRDALYYDPPFTGGVTRTVQSKLADVVSANDLGIPLDGSTRAHTALQRVADTGKSFTLPPGTFRTDVPIVLRTDGQIVQGSGRGPSGSTAGTRMVPMSNNDVWQVGYQTAAVSNVAIRDMYFQTPSGRTGGYCISLNNVGRTTLENFIWDNLWGGLYVRKANITTLSNVWGNIASGPAWIHYDGTVDRSDCLIVDNVQVGETMSSGITPVNARPYGLLWDGNCHTLRIRNFAAVGVRQGIRSQNSAGLTGIQFPHFLYAHNIEIDFTYEHCLRFDSGTMLNIAGYYGNSGGNSLEDSIYIATGVNNVTISGGQNYAWQKRSVYCDGTDCHFHNLFSGGGSIGGSGLYGSFYFDQNARRCTVNGGSAGIYAGSVGNVKCGVETHALANDIAVIGTALGGVTADYIAGNENNLTVVGCPGSNNNMPTDNYWNRVAIDGNFYARLNGLVPLINFDASTYLEFDRSSQRYLFRTASNPLFGMYTDRTESFLPHRMHSYAKTALPTPTANLEGSMIYVTNDVGGKTIAFCDGTNWRRVQDLAVIS